MATITAEQAMTIVGTIGGFAISLSLVPQVYLTYRTKCADDISYTYQFIYIFGTALVNAYAIYFSLYAVYIPCLVEFSLIVTLTIMKAVYPPRKDLLDCSRHSAMLANGAKGNLSLPYVVNEDLACDGDRDLTECEKNMLIRKSITLLKRLAVEGHFDVDAATEKDLTELEESIKTTSLRSPKEGPRKESDVEEGSTKASI